MLIAGLDEAGRGPVLGPLCIGCVVFEESQLFLLDELGIDDSKQLSAKKRKELAILIKENCVSWKVMEITAEMINNLHDHEKLTLNQIEEKYFALTINDLEKKPDKIYLDACDPVEDRFGRSIGVQLNYKPQEIISKHKGDSIFKIVGAGSILAKVYRDNILESYKDTYGNCGSGYPSDPATRKFLTEYYKKHQNFPPIVRTWWKTAENVKKDFIISKTQKKLTDF